jgi:hypothetical protein
MFPAARNRAKVDNRSKFITEFSAAALAAREGNNYAAKGSPRVRPGRRGSRRENVTLIPRQRAQR